MKRFLKHLLWIMAVSVSPVMAASMNCRVVSVTDGDTIRCQQGNQQHRIRFAGIDAPESKQAFGQQAKAVLNGLIYQKNVWVEVSGRDRYGRLIGTVYLGHEDINRRMVAEGCAWAYRRYLQKDYLAVEAVARKNHTRLWQEPGAVYPERFRHQ